MKPRLTQFGDYEHRVKLDVWSGYVVHIVFTKDFRRSYFERYRRQRDLSDARAFTASSMNGHTHLFFKIGDAPSGIIAHECWHALVDLYDHCGVKEYENEVTAYHLGHLVEKAVDFREHLIKFGVKSATEVTNDTQRSNGRVRRMQPGTKKETRTSSKAS